jgi:recombination protein RecA
MRGRLVELSGHGAAATLTAAVELVLEAQHAAEPVAWLRLDASSFFPPDLADSGVDLGALVVVRVGDPAAAARGAARLLQSGAFGLVVLDFAGGGTLELAMAQQGRLVGLAQNHDAAVVCLTDKPADVPSLSSLVSLRAEATRDGDRDDAIRIDVRKDKQRGAGGVHVIALAREDG